VLAYHCAIASLLQRLVSCYKSSGFGGVIQGSSIQNLFLVGEEGAVGAGIGDAGDGVSGDEFGRSEELLFALIDFSFNELGEAA
jgi:hypothetical protein